MSESVRLSGSALSTGVRDDFSVIEHALENYLAMHGAAVPSESERRSWRNSLPVLAADLDAAGLSGVEVILEHRLPMSNKRVDAVLAGCHPDTGRPSYVLVELKQWSGATRWGGTDTLVDVTGAPYRPALHPAVQVAGYGQYLRDFVAVLAEDSDAVVPVAYLHNATDSLVQDLLATADGTDARIFTGQHRTAFREFLRQHLADDSGPEAADALLTSPVRPSKQLLEHAAAEIRERRQFVLLDEQRVAFELVLHAVEGAHNGAEKTAVLVTGAPGSGKSVIALSVMGELARRGTGVVHATGSRSFTQTMRQVAGRGSSRTKNLFKYFNSFVAAEPDTVDVAVLDEAHRIREKSVHRFTPKALRDNARPQVEELLDVARVPVFLLDEHQVVRPGEMGTVADIKAHAAGRGMNVLQVDLAGQFRAGGSDRYNDWVHDLLGLASDSPHRTASSSVWRDEPNFTVDVVDSVEELESRLRTKVAAGENARITAGFCWTWSDPNKDGTLVRDVRIGSWSRPWNLKSDRAVGGAPPASLWASDPAGFEQVGCVYTAQGFEYAWNGVVIGPDLVWRGDRWVARRACNKDPDFRSRSGVDGPTFDRLVRNVYKVLLTRGLRGTLLYSVDPETQAMLRARVNPADCRPPVGSTA